MDKQFAVIGCQHTHIDGMIRKLLSLGYECCGIFDSGDRTIAEKLSLKYNISLASQLDELMSRSFTLVVSSAINNEKIELIEWCERQGKHIILDKPVVTCREGLDRLSAVLERGQIHVGMSLSQRFHPAIHALKAKIDNGDLGDLVSITMRKPHRLSPQSRSAWHFSKQQNGGLIIDLFIHDFDLLRWLTGEEISEMSSVLIKNGQPQYPDFYDVAGVQAVVGRNILAQLYTDWHTPDKSWSFGDCRIFATGNKGYAELRLNGDPMISMKGLMITSTDHQEWTLEETEESTGHPVEDFIRRLTDNGAHIVTHKDIYLASKAAVEADEQAIRIRNL